MNLLLRPGEYVIHAGSVPGRAFPSPFPRRHKRKPHPLDIDDDEFVVLVVAISSTHGG